jgi:hypothetical protein
MTVVLTLFVLGVNGSNGKLKHEILDPCQGSIFGSSLATEAKLGEIKENMASIWVAGEPVHSAGAS